MKSDRERSALQAAEAHTDLNVFAAVVILLESSLQTSARHAASQRIIRICKAEQQRCLRDFDLAMAKATGGAA